MYDKIIPISMDQMNINKASSTFACMSAGFMKGGEFSEKDWPENEDELDAYAKSKLKAEKEAWEFVKNLEGLFNMLFD